MRALRDSNDGVRFRGSTVVGRVCGRLGVVVGLGGGSVVGLLGQVLLRQLTVAASGRATASGNMRRLDCRDSRGGVLFALRRGGAVRATNRRGSGGRLARIGSRRRGLQRRGWDSCLGEGRKRRKRRDLVRRSGLGGLRRLSGRGLLALLRARLRSGRRPVVVKARTTRAWTAQVSGASRSRNCGRSTTGSREPVMGEK